VDEAESLDKNVQHIRQIVAMQQSFSRVFGVTESSNPSASWKMPFNLT